MELFWDTKRPCVLENMAQSASLCEENMWHEAKVCKEKLWTSKRPCVGKIYGVRQHVGKFLKNLWDLYKIQNSLGFEILNSIVATFTNTTTLTFFLVGQGPFTLILH